MTDFTASHKGIELDLINLFNENKKKIDSKAFVQSIFKKMLDNKFFLSFFVQVKDLNKILKMKYSSANDIAKVILRDTSLTSKLLKLVNSSFYGLSASNGQAGLSASNGQAGQISNKKIASISEAMVILGTEEIKLAALSLKIYELMISTANFRILKNMALRSLQRSIIARTIVLNSGVLNSGLLKSDSKNSEAIQASAMLYDFGQYLLALFSPEVFLDIEVYADENNLSPELASKSIIGISYNELSRLVASKWNLPFAIISAMKPVTELNVHKNKLTVDEYQRNICSFSNELCNIDFSMDNKYIDKKIMKISKNYKKPLGITAAESADLLKISWNNIIKHASILKADIKNKYPYFLITTDIQ